MKILHTTVWRLLIASLVVLSATASFAQVKIGDNPTTINPGSVLELESANKGLLMPRIGLTNTTVWGLLGTPAAGMHVYNTNASIVSTNTAYPTLEAKIGEYYWDGTGWVALATVTKSTVITTFQQSAGVVVTLPYAVSAGYCNALSCATYLNLGGNFAIRNGANDVVVDFTGYSNVTNNSTPVAYNFFLAIDKTTPGVFESIDGFYYTEVGTGCVGNSFNYKSVLKNLPVRAVPYQVRVYLAPWVNGGTVAQFGMGASALVGCGGGTPDRERLVVSVSQ
ncbi:MAG: hypothetical protein J7619_01605 [Dyadobacter sp.]|uniref:hypothetical protein n=1 Tax=Dyadobacter sp. TaxID=1914288 RepID=UPI001B1A5E96|nr:hypothetical protein [Dyadobacter sp.]MBO9611356.1 hypothetical protein [Dyadobacter sp.]